MRSLALNTAFLGGLGCIVAAAFLVSTPLGLLVLGCPLVAFAVHMQLVKAKS